MTKHFKSPTFLLIIALTALNILRIESSGFCKYLRNVGDGGRYCCDYFNLIDDGNFTFDGGNSTLGQGEHLSGFTDDDVKIFRTIFYNISIPTLDSAITDKFKNLETLSLRYANVVNITEDALTNCGSLEVLNFWADLLTELPSNFLKNCDKLKSLELRRNKISILQSDVLTGAVNLEEFLMPENHVPLSIHQDFFSPISSLKSFYMFGVTYQSLPRNLLRGQKKLEIVEMSRSNLKDFSIIKDLLNGLTNVKILSISDNDFKSIDYVFLRTMISLTDLNLSNNPFGAVTSRAFPSFLQRLHLANAGISQIQEDSFQGLINLLYLDLNSNPLDELPKDLFRYLKNVEKILLNNCNLKQLNAETFQLNTNLKVISLTNNEIAELPEGIFNSTTQLMSFDLDQNKIHKLNRNSFGNHEKVTIFWIKSNQIDKIEPKFFENFPNLDWFMGDNNLCVNRTIGSDNFKTETEFNGCYRNWENEVDETATVGTADTTTPASGHQIGGILSGIVFGLIIQCFA